MDEHGEPETCESCGAPLPLFDRHACPNDFVGVMTDREEEQMALVEAAARAIPAAQSAVYAKDVLFTFFDDADDDEKAEIIAAAAFIDRAAKRAEAEAGGEVEWPKPEAVVAEGDGSAFWAVPS